MNREVHAEIEFIRESDGMPIHSDICPPGHSSVGLSDKEYRRFLHDSLDEWLNNSGGTGQFYIKGESCSAEFNTPFKPEVSDV